MSREKVSHIGAKFQQENAFYKANKELIDDTFSGMYIVIRNNKVVAASADLETILRYRYRYFSADIPVSTPKIPMRRTIQMPGVRFIKRRQPA